VTNRSSGADREHGAARVGLRSVAVTVAVSLLATVAPLAAPSLPVVGARPAGAATATSTFHLLSGVQATVSLDEVPPGTPVDQLAVQGSISVTAPQAPDATVMAFDLGDTAERVAAQRDALAFAQATAPAGTPLGVIGYAGTAAVADAGPAAGAQDLALPAADANANGVPDFDELAASMRVGGIDRFSPVAVSPGLSLVAGLERAADVLAGAAGTATRIVLVQTRVDPSFSRVAANAAVPAGVDVVVVSLVGCASAVNLFARDHRGQCRSIASLSSAVRDGLGTQMRVTAAGLNAFHVTAAGNTQHGITRSSSGPALPANAPWSSQLDGSGPVSIDNNTLCTNVTLVTPAGEQQLGRCQPLQLLPSFLEVPQAPGLGARSGIDPTARWAVRPAGSAVELRHLPSGQVQSVPFDVLGGPTGFVLDMGVSTSARRIWANSRYSLLLHDRDPDGNGDFDEAGQSSTIPVVFPEIVAGQARQVFGVTSSADGRWLVADVGSFIGNSSTAVNHITYLIDATTGAISAITPVTYTGYRRSAAISGGGRYVALATFQDDVPAASTPGSDLVLLDRDTDGDGVFDEAGATSWRQLLHDVDTANISMTSDGARLAFATASALLPSDTDSVGDVYVLRPATGQFEHVTRSGGAARLGSDLALSASGRRVAVVQDGHGVVIDRDADADGVFDEGGATRSYELDHQRMGCTPPSRPPYMVMVSSIDATAAFETNAPEVLDGMKEAEQFFVPILGDVKIPARISAGAAVDVTEGGSVSRLIDVCDDGGAVSLSIDPGDGSAPYGSQGAGPFSLSATYLDDATTIARIDAVDLDGVQSTLRLPVSVRNAAPEVHEVIPTLPGTAAPATVTVLAPFSDEGLEDTHEAVIDWGDGNTSVGEVTPIDADGDGSVAGSHVYAHGGDYAVSVTVTDDDGGLTTQTEVVSITSAGPSAPVIASGGGLTVTEGAVGFGIRSFTDPDSSTWTATYVNGEGAPPSNLLVHQPTRQVQFSSIWYREGTYRSTLQVTDDSGLTGIQEIPVTVVNANPVVDGLALDSPSVRAGSLALVRAIVTDPGRSDVLSVSIDWGDGTVTAAPVEWDGKVRASHEYSAAGSYPIVVTATDGDGGSAVADIGIDVTPANRGPELDLGADITLPQGANFQRTVTLSDPDGSGITSAFVDWGDGTPAEAVVVAPDSTVLLAHRYLRRGQWTLRLDVADDEDAVGGDDLTVTVTNVAPAIGTITASPDDSVAVGDPVTFSAAAGDVGTAAGAALPGSVTFGDGGGDQAVAVVGGALSVTHAFALPGVYTVRLSVSDGLASAASSKVIEVVVPNGAPSAVDDRYTTTFGQPLVVGAPGVLSNDRDPDGDTLHASVVSGPASGSLTFAADGSFTYTPNAGFVGNDSFTYSADDGAGGSSVAVVAIAVADRLVATVQQPINTRGDSVFKAGRGTVPVKWRLSRNGSSTCDLPGATIRVVRISGAVEDAVNEAVYGDGPDTGTAYRTADCQYHYNISTKSLSAGEYRVSILIGGGLVGEAVFQLR
jgi:hypothetical protein